MFVNETKYVYTTIIGKTYFYIFLPKAMQNIYFLDIFCAILQCDKSCVYVLRNE